VARTRIPSLDDWRVQRLLDWLCTLPGDRIPKTQGELAELFGISYQLLVSWKDDPDFLAAWEHKYQKTIGSVQRQQAVMEALYETACDRTDPRQVVAAKAYLDALGISKPQRPQTVKDAKKLTDEQLYALAAERIIQGSQDG
jgi:hypothetical protein